jgi:hypothetical protein
VRTDSFCAARRNASRADSARHAFHLKNHPAAPHRSDPQLGRTLAFSHARFRRLLGERLVREDANPDAATALDVARQRDTAASSWRAATTPFSVDCSAKSPKARLLPRPAQPRIRPFCNLAVLNFFRL